MSEDMPDSQPKLGRPTKYDPKYCDMLIESLSQGGSIATFASEIRVARSTINEWASVNEDFSEALKIAKTTCAAWWEARLRNVAMLGGAPGQATAVIFGLKNMASDDWREKSESERQPMQQLALPPIIINPIPTGSYIQDDGSIKKAEPNAD